MTTEIASAGQATIQLYGQSLPPHERSKHRAWIGVRVEALLDPFWQTRPSEVVKMEILTDWMDELEAFTQAEIRAACREWLRQEGARKPKYGDIRAIILRGRSEALRSRAVPSTPEQDEAYRQSVARDRINPDRKKEADAIMARFNTGNREGAQ